MRPDIGGTVDKVAFYTLGCKVNQYETEAMAEAFERAGYELVDFEEAADVYVINTCTVTGLSSRKSRQAIRRAKQLNRSAIVAAVGCYPQTAREEVENIPEVDIVAGTAERLRLPEYVERFRNGEGRISEVGNIMRRHAFEDLKIERYKGRTRAFLKIQEGCSQFCSYCIIPYARGPIRSRPAEDVIAEVRKLSEAGFREVVLTGIHIASYGRDQGQIRLPDLIKLVHDVDGIERIRLGSLEPTLITADFVAQAAGLEKLCPHYHISLQSGCDETLARMNRKYKTADYKKAVDMLREQIPDVSITTDVMVGFPGETEEEFNKTFGFLETIRFAKMHVFKYSPRKGTPAASFEDQVDGTVKEYRSARVMELSDRCALEFNSRFLGREMPVLYEQEVRDSGGLYEGLTPNYIRVLSNADSSVMGNIIKTKFTGAEKDFVTGRI
jgi:threonylcarbamoyladenosine tRNA methylthiotransferase MtaB